MIEARRWDPTCRPACGHERIALLPDLRRGVAAAVAPAGELFVNRPRLDMHVGGSEANVAAALASLGHGAAIVTVLPDNALGDTALAAMRSAGVDVANVGRDRGRMGVYWSETGASLRPTEIIYDRAGSAFVMRDDASWDWAAILRGAGHLHLSGITVAVGESATRSAIAAAQAAVHAGIPVSFDGNYRERLWADRGGVDVPSLRELASTADVLFGDHRDVSLLLGRRFAGDTPEDRGAAAEAAFAAFPRLKLMASTVRVSAHVGEHALSARIDRADHGIETEPLVIPGVIDRIGSGDAFVAGVLHAMWRGDPIEGIARSGIALAGLKHSMMGDAAWVTERQLAAFSNGTMDVRR